MGTKKPSRDEVLAWMRETGQGPRPAARHFGISFETAKTWQRRARGSPAPALNPAPEPVEEPAPIEPAKVSAGSKPRSSRAASKPPPVDLARLPSDVRDQLRDAMLNRIAHLADRDSVGTKGERDTAITLGILLDKAGEILTIEEKLDAAGAGGVARTGAIAGADALDRLRRAVRGRGPGDEG